MSEPLGFSEERLLRGEAQVDAGNYRPLREAIEELKQRHNVTDKRWKRGERKHAADMGTERIPVTGRQRDLGGADYETEMFAFSDKDGYERPAYLENWIAAIESYARQRNRIPVIVWHKPGKKRSEDLVFLRWSDWTDLHGKRDARDG